MGNIVDNLVFSFLAYIDLSDVYENGAELTLRQIWQRLGRDACFEVMRYRENKKDREIAC